MYKLPLRPPLPVLRDASLTSARGSAATQAVFAAAALALCTGPAQGRLLVVRDVLLREVTPPSERRTG